MTVIMKRGLGRPATRSLPSSRWTTINKFDLGASHAWRENQHELANALGSRAASELNVILNLIAHRIRSRAPLGGKKTIRLIYLHIFRRLNCSFALQKIVRHHKTSPSSTALQCSNAWIMKWHLEVIITVLWLYWCEIASSDAGMRFSVAAYSKEHYEPT